MKKLILIQITYLLAHFAWAQVYADKVKVQEIANSNVGIGTDNPKATLHVQGTSWDDTPNVQGTQVLSGILELTRTNYGPFIDFQNDVDGINYDARLRLSANDYLELLGAHLSIMDRDLRDVRGLQLKDWDDNTGGRDNKYRLLARDGAFMFYNGGVVVGQYSNGTWSDVPDGQLVVRNKLGIGTTVPSELLTVSSSGDGRALGSFRATGSGDAGIYFDASNGDLSGADYGSLLQSNDLAVSLNNYGNNPLHLRTNNTTRVTVVGNGNVGIGTSTPAELLHVNGAVFIGPASNINNESPGIVGNANDDFMFSGRYINHYGFGFHTYGEGLNSYTSGYYGINVFTEGKQRMRIEKNGNVGIGTASPTEKLHVNGRIRATGQVGWSDFVFYDDYDLPTLDEVEAHIAEEGHLKDIPSEQEVLEEGIDLTEMDARLLQKIEELTLYIIDQNKRLEQLEMENKAQAQQIHRLEKR
ncbi:MAG: hypothetical protein AAGA85_22425 [Bacteroidota bacterium]